MLQYSSTLSYSKTEIITVSTIIQCHTIVHSVHKITIILWQYITFVYNHTVCNIVQCIKVQCSCIIVMYSTVEQNIVYFFIVQSNTVLYKVTLC